MFTGRISETGVVEEVAGESVRIGAPKSAGSLEPGGSVCVDGVRLTVRDLDDRSFRATVTAETRRRSTFDTTADGARVNIETPLRLGDVLDGHLVQGYVDAVGKVVRVDAEGTGHRVWIRPPERMLNQLVGKAPIAVDGVSVTVAEVLRDRFSIVVLPVTASATGLGALAPGDRVNLEADLVARLVARRGAAAGREVEAVVTGLHWAGHVSGRTGVDKAVRQLAAGGGVVVWDPATEGEADVVFAGARLKPDAFRFLLTAVCGLPAVPCAPEVLDRLGIDPIPGDGDRHGTAFCVPVDLASAEGTGVSAAERAATVRRMADPTAVPADFLRPGHISPLRARPGLLGERQGHTEATVALCAAAGLPPVGVCCEVMNHDGTMAGAADAEVAAVRWGMPLVDLADLREWL
ncbi:riboflavin synthase [Amycolatopsis sp. CA-230715]|uniref:riboflavin synthase n=1 Tax=Amycolatopsis sp. CA-230715 TaxID=2745196 RepID=UPI001C02286F|nr:riboflavin synthase [Amycolatopsis sp. CA-230715]QWF84678.1 3,4-dihydroxy-2-butanone 4-phosphate synthase [Amycolatopsis sp. CA-230715]